MTSAKHSALGVQSKACQLQPLQVDDGKFTLSIQISEDIFLQMYSVRCVKSLLRFPIIKVMHRKQPGNVCTHKSRAQALLGARVFWDSPW